MVETCKKVLSIIKVPEVAGLIMILLSVYKLAMPNAFSNALSILISGSGELSFLMNLIQVVSFLLFFASVLVLIVFIIFSIFVFFKILF
jgi:hypothetical protein